MVVKFCKDGSFAFCVFLLAATNFAYMHYCVGPIDFIKRPLDLWEPLCYVCFDSSILLLLCYIFSFGYIKASGIICVCASSIWSLLNVLYSRYFDVYFNYHTLRESRNMKEGFMWEAAKSALKIEDCIYLIVFIVFFILLYFVKPKKRDWQYRIKTAGILTGMPIFIIMIYGGGKAILSAASELRHIENRVRTLAVFPKCREKYIFENGVFCAQLFYDYITDGVQRDLSPTEIRQIQKQHEITHENPNLLKPQKNKNLIFILVESYLSISSDMAFNGKEITPNLNRLRHTKGVYFNDCVTTNIELGASGDGQFIYMTGLLPLKGRITTSRVAKNTLPALPKLLKENNECHTMMTIPTNPHLWMQTDMCKAYGIEQLYSTDNMNFHVNDSTILDYSIKNELDLAGKVFFHTVLTINMHCPYSSHSDVEFDFPSHYSPEFCEYLRRCHFTDRQIGRFLQQLIDTGLYENSVIVIASDHEAKTESLNIEEIYSGNKKLPLYIANSDMDLEKCWYGEMNQIDLFPTLLDIFGINSEWRGLGCSITDSASYKNMLKEDTYLVSGMIIDSDYFSKYSINEKD